MSPDARAGRLAASQAGNITRRQLRDAGLSRREIEGRLDRGVLVRRFRGVFAVGHVPEGRFSLAFAAWLTYGGASGLSHRDCAAVLGVLPEPDGAVDVSRPEGGRSQGGTRLHEADVEDDLWDRQGLRVTSPARLLLDLAATEPAAVVERAWNEAQVRRLVTPSQLERRIEGWAGRRGVSLLRSFIDDRGVTRSVFEDGFRRFVRRSGVRPPDFNEWVDGVFVDAVWRQERVVVELDSRGFHMTARTFEADRRKTNALQLRGWIVLRITYRRLADEPLAVLRELVTALSRQGQIDRLAPVGAVSLANDPQGGQNDRFG